jgi:hypothetical protein
MNEAAVQLLYDTIHALPHDEYGVINFLPFSHDSDQTRTVKRHLCEAIVNLLDANGFVQNDVTPVQPLMSHDVVVTCRICGNELVQMNTNAEGVGSVNAAMFIGSISRLKTECPHGVTTLDDMRLHMEREFIQAQEEDNDST